MKGKKGAIPGWVLGLVIAIVFLIIAALIILISKGWGSDLIAHIKSILRLV